MSTKKDDLNKFKPASDAFEFREFPFYWVMKLSNQYAHRMEKALKKENINITTWRVAMILRQVGALSITGISTHAASRLPTITKTVYKMQDRGLVDIKPQEGDGRVSVVTITQLGLKTVESVIENTTKLFDSTFDNMSAQQLQELNSTLQKLCTNLSID